MSKKYMVLVLIVLICLVNTALYLLDHSYHLTKDSISIYNKKNKITDENLTSPSKDKLLYFKHNHWKVSPVFTQLEDVFYPFRKWSDSLNQTRFMASDYASYKTQLQSLVKSEKATFVRAKKAYVVAKKLNFNKPDLNNDAAVKKRQWLTNFNELFNRNILLKNGR